MRDVCGPDAGHMLAVHGGLGSRVARVRSASDGDARARARRTRHARGRARQPLGARARSDSR
eukprot:3424025-Prymnesium_polylepis.1